MSNITTSTISKELSSKLQKSTVEVIKGSNSLPKIGDGFELYASYPDYAEFMGQQKLRILSAMRKLLSNVGCKVKIPQLGLEDMEKVIFGNDLLVERAATSIEQHSASLTYQFLETRALQSGAEVVPGFTILNVPPITTSGQGPYLSQKDSGGRYIALRRNESGTVISGYSQAIIDKPQVRFLDPKVNVDEPFIHKLQYKHNAINPTRNIDNLKIIDEQIDGQQSRWGIDQELSEHPYQYELDCFVVPKDQLFLPTQFQPYLPVEDTPLVIVDTKNKLEKLIEVLKNVREFAVDLEHHDYRSFLGLTCLIQISTRTTDYIIDPFPLWNDMWHLNEPFTDPKIVKVFHGCNSDLLWLQKNFRIYTINICDTHIFLKALNAAGKLGLKDLIKQECGVTLSKDLQKADWRERPLSDKHLLYARLDTHFLLCCYDKLRIKLSRQNISALISAFEECNKMSYLLFQQPRFDQNGHLILVKSSRQPFNNRQLEALRHLYKWRDTTARKQDESVHYVLQTHMMIRIAQVMPKDVQGILGCCSPIPPLVNHNAATILGCLNFARKLSLESTELSVADKLSYENSISSNTEVEEENRITERKAKLEYPFDNSVYKADQEIPSIESRLNMLDNPKFAKAKVENTSPIKLIPLKKDSVQNIKQDIKSAGKLNSEKKAAPNQTKVKRIEHEMNQLPTPYELYKLQQKKKQRRNMKTIKLEEC